MKFLAMEHEMPNVSGSDFKPHLKAEALRVWELYQSGIFRELYFDKNKHNAVIILECQDIKEADAYLQTLPLVKAGLISFEIVELEPYSGFARLFEDVSKGRFC